MKVLFISDSNLTHPILQTQGIPYLISNAKRGIQYTLVTFEKKNGNNKNPYYSNLKKRLVECKIHHIEVTLPENLFPSGRLWYWVLGVIKVMKLFFRFKFDIIHSRGYPPMFIALISKFVFSPKVIFDMRGILPEEIVEAGILTNGSLIYKFEKFFEKIYLKYSDTIITVSDNLTRYAQRLLSEESYNKIIKIKNRIPLDKFFYNQRKGFDFNNLILIYTGNFTTKYDIHCLYNIFETLNRFSNNCKLIILTYMDKKPFIDLSENLSSELRERIEINSCSNDEVPSYLNYAHVGVIPLKPLESNFVSAPIKLIEYLACGLPVLINKNIGDSQELVLEKKIGVFINENNYEKTILDLKKLLSDTDIFLRCREIAEKEFDIDITAQQFYSIYLRLL